MRTRSLGFVLAILALLTFTPRADAALIWGNSAGSNEIDAWDLDTGQLVHSFHPNKGNGRGVVVVGNVVYFTVVGDGNIYKLDATTGAPLGSFGSGQSSLSTISFDGTNFWLADYSGTKNAYLISPTGAPLKTIQLSSATGNTDGLEFFNGKLIANRSDGCCTDPTPYDIFDLNGNVLTSAFITAPHNETGIAFDGTNFITSDVRNGKVDIWNGTTGSFIKSVTLIGGNPLIEDLSVDFAQRSDTCGQPNQPPCSDGGGTGVPEPSTVLLLSSGFVGLVAWRRYRRK